MANGILLVGFDYSDAQVDEFNDWYDLEHIPERQSVTGFGACQRWVDQPLNYSVATYELATVNVLDSESYLAIAYDNLSAWSKRVTAKCKRLVRFEGTLINGEQAIIPAEAGGLLVNAMNVAPQHEDDPPHTLGRTLRGGGALPGHPAEPDAQPTGRRGRSAAGRGAEDEHHAHRAPVRAARPALEPRALGWLA